MMERLALIGFGEAGETFASAAEWGDRATAFDVALPRQATSEACGVATARSAAQALSGAPLVLSLVTADQALVVAQDCASALAPGAIWCDMNSVAPQTKQQAALAIEAAGGHYVDVAVLAPVKPAALDVPLLLSGAAAELAKERLRAAGFTNIKVVGDEVGRASAIKMVRSVMIKGLEALTAEMILAANQAGVRDEVLASLDASETRMNWAERAAYQLERMIQHGVRRAAEMEEAAKTLEGLGVDPVMTRGTVLRQREMGTARA